MPKPIMRGHSNPIPARLRGWAHAARLALLAPLPAAFAQSADGDFGSGGAPRKTTFRSGSGSPVLAPEPNPELGAFPVDVDTPAGPLRIFIRPAGRLAAGAPPAAASPGDYRPPSLFSAPLPTGSGARALGFAGAFSAVADDATAASWNPAGLLQLEQPEVSAVLRHQRVTNRHVSDDPDFRVGEDSHDSGGLNYASLAWPFLCPPLNRNMVLSLNYQESYDFTQSFHASVSDRAASRSRSAQSAVYRERQLDQVEFQDGVIEVEVLTDITTRSSSRLDVRATSALEARLDFEQQGRIDAITPALALEITPRLYLGAALNFHQDGLGRDGDIVSRTRAAYEARAETVAVATTDSVTGGSYRSSGVVHLPGFPPFLPPRDLLLGESSGTLPNFRRSTESRTRDTVTVSGTVEQEDRYRDLGGWNGTLGGLWTVNRFCVLSLAADLGWTADATQARTVTRTETVRDASGAALGATRRETTTDVREVRLEFPLLWTAGAVLRWTPEFYTSLDVSRTDWSRFAYDIEGVGRINPFDGTPHGRNPVEDTWSARVGTEYLWITRRADIPFRLGLMYEERPAPGSPDPYYGFSAGTGLAVGPAGRRWILDLAYQFLTADDVRTVIPEQRGLSTDTDQHLFYISLIRHL